MGADRLAGLRRVVAGFGGRVVVRGVSEPVDVVEVRRPAPPQVSVRAGDVAVVVGTAPARLPSRADLRTHSAGTIRVAARRATAVRSSAVVRGQRATLRARVRSVPGQLARRVVDAHRARPLPRAGGVRGPVGVLGRVTSGRVSVGLTGVARSGGVRRVASMRRAPLAWGELPRARLAVAWRAVRAAHGGEAADLELVGVYGPVPLSALTGVALGPGRVAVLSLAQHRRAPLAGDLALARRRADGSLVSAAVPAGAHPRRTGAVKG
ncbi:MAG TPA: hypothetical protein PKE32_03550 [Miltoncostaeaceae bacterium]|nr:hypothetical protein [Miltoncostaeaceae bacterium]